MTVVYAQNEYEMIRACGYIKDDKYLSSYYGVPLQKIERMREKANARNKNRFENRAYKETGEVIDFRGYDAKNASMMAKGSRMLLESLVTFFNDRERKLRHAAKP